jgi:hypothetical protein
MQVRLPYAKVSVSTARAPRNVYYPSGKGFRGKIRENPTKELSSDTAQAALHQAKSEQISPSIIPNQILDGLLPSLQSKQDETLAALRQLIPILTKNDENTKIDAGIKEKIIRVLEKTTIVNVDIKNEVEISKYLVKLGLQDLAAQRLVKFLETDKLSDDSLSIASRLEELRRKLSVSTYSNTIKLINASLTKLLQTPIDSSQLTDINSDSSYAENEMRFADLYRNNSELNSLAKARLIRLLKEKNLSFFDQKCSYDYLKKNPKATEQEKEIAGTNIIKNFEFPKELNPKIYQFILNGLSEICEEIPASDSRSLSFMSL